jgi:hypothetical protein
MTVECPVPQWPTALLEQGPPEGSSILLRGQVAIGKARFMVTAIRVDPIRFGPDFRADRNLAIYAEHQLPTLLDMVAELVGVADPSTLRLATGQYVVWMLPAAEDT